MNTGAILSIDATRPVLRAVVTSGSGSEISIINSLQLDASTWWNRFFTDNGTASDSPLNATTDGREPGEHPQSADRTLPPDRTPSAATEMPRPDEPSASAHSFHFPIQEILKSIPRSSFDESLIILPPHRALALHLELPFAHKASLSRIAPLEAQDKVPFDVSTFHLHARPIRKLPSNLFDIQVDLYPDDLLSDLISTCKEQKFEPSLVTIPPALGELCHELYPKYISSNSLLVFPGEKSFAVAVLVDGAPVGYFSIPLDNQQIGDGSPGKFPGNSMLNIWIAAIEDRFQCSIDRIYFVGEDSDFHIWSRESLLRSSETLSFGDLLPNCDGELGLPALAATALAQDTPEPVVPNYRTGKYLFRPELRNIREQAHALLKPLLIILGVLLVLLPFQYLLREQRISSLNRQLHESTKRALPGAAIEPGREPEAVSSKLQEIRSLLEQLGTEGTISPQKELVLILDSMKKYGNLQLRRINILSNLTIIEGTAESYQSAEEIENSFKRFSDVYCKVHLDTSGSGPRSGQQRFELQLSKVCTS